MALFLSALVIGPTGETALASVPLAKGAAAKGAAYAIVPAAADDAPPTRPGGLRPCPVPFAANPTGYASICWAASSDDIGIAGYDLYRLDPGGFVLAATTTSTVGGFSGELNHLYTMYVVARDLAGHLSPPSALITVPALLGMTPSTSPTPLPGDHVPPSKPAGLRDACLQDYAGVTFCWQPSTDNVAVTAYDVYRETATSYSKVGTVVPPSTNFAEPGLVVGRRYTYVVVAKDAADNLSTPSDPLSALAREGLPSPTPTSGAACSVSYRAMPAGSRLDAEVTVRNTGTEAVDGWTLTVGYPASAGVRLVSGWSANWTQAGTGPAGTNKQWNKVIGVGSAVQVGFTAAYGGPLPAPESFALNGKTCASG
ncbi:cellulose binding domain-containing protein [Nonomuraea spiralis]|uniref:Cellulose binding domain-containing protein n=1 Tax=Nonomuraea spiralis TaxID=46182 RepID=A0ABV5IUK6_9ACTN|nr:cellulose binding domain-containing protein [Nonomuraea spiralis]